MLMIANEEGNLHAVRQALSELRVGDIVDPGPRNPLLAEIVPDVTPNWHVIETLPNHERSVAAHLIARRFGMFVPETEEDIVRRGRKLHVTRLMFTGYVFVFVWDIAAHAGRLTSIPGVARLMCHPAVDGGFPKPVVVADSVINRIRAVENSKRPLPAITIEGLAYSPKHKRRRWRKHRRDQQKAELAKASEVIAVRPWDAFQDAIATLDEGGRNQTLLVALGLSS